MNCHFVQNNSYILFAEMKFEEQLKIHFQYQGTYSVDPDS